MKILEAQNALLTNYEVYQHIINTQERAKKHKRRLPGNLATLLTEVITYLREEPGPLATQTETGPYHQQAFSELIERLDAEKWEKSEIVKGELLNIFNIRPQNTAVLSTMVEDMEERFTEDEQQRLIDIIGDVLGGRVDGIAEQDAVPSVENGN